jgi:hypothetical protein
MKPRSLSWLYLLAGLGLMLSAFLPTGLIETPWPPYHDHPWAWMEPCVWPFILMGLMLMGAGAWESVRPKAPSAAIILGTASILLFLYTLFVGRRTIYGPWFPDQLGPPDLLVFDLWVLLAHYAVMLALLPAGLVALGRAWRRAHPAAVAPPAAPRPAPAS